MTLRLEDSLRNAMADAATAAFDVGAANARIEFQAAPATEVATIPLQKPSFGAASAGVTQMLGAPLQDTDATGGVTDIFSLYDGNNSKRLEGDVSEAGGGGDIIISSTTIGNGDIVELTSFQFTMPVS